MALKKLGSSYMVGADSTAQASFNDDIYYRGWKDFLVWVPSYNANQQAVVTAYSGESKKVSATLYRCSNLLDDPGTYVGKGSGDRHTEGSTRCILHAGFRSGRSDAFSGLFRLRVMPEDNEPFFQVNMKNLAWYSLECIEPALWAPYVLGTSGGDAFRVTTSSFLKLDEDETVTGTSLRRGIQRRCRSSKSSSRVPIRPLVLTLLKANGRDQR